MRATLIACVMLLAIAGLSLAQEVSGDAPRWQRLPPVDSSQQVFDPSVVPAAFRFAAQPGTVIAPAAPPTASSYTSQTYTSAAENCPQCCCAPCQCPETPAPCLPCTRINLLNPSWNLLLGGTLEFDMLFNSARPVAPGVPFFLTPGSPTGASQATFDGHARQTTLYALFNGPQIGEFKAGGQFLATLFNDAIIVDRYGFLPILAFGQLQSEDWRFAAGLQLDIFAPLFPTVLPYSFLAASGNAGVYRGQLRAERFFRPSDERQIKLTVGISDPVATTVNNVELSEDNGWPNIEMRVALGLGAEQQTGLLPLRPFEVGISSVVGQLRTINGLARVVANVWGLAADFRWRVNESWGFAGEIYSGQALGTYGAAIFQNVNAVTFEPVHVTGGWLEGYYYLTECLHSHTGFAIDDPVDSELAPSQIAFNRTIFTNLIWDVTRSFRLAGELTFRKTNYITFTDNDGVGFRARRSGSFRSVPIARCEPRAMRRD